MNRVIIANHTINLITSSTDPTSLVSDCCLLSSELFLSISWREQDTFYFRRDHDDIHTVLSKHS